jgi:hypothetical protein
MNKILIVCLFTIIIIVYFLFSHQQIEKYVKYGDTNIKSITSQSKSASIEYTLGKITLPINIQCTNLTKEQQPLVGINCIMQQKGFKFQIDNKNPFITLPGFSNIEKLVFDVDINNVDYYDYDKLKIVKQWFKSYISSGDISVSANATKTLQIPFTGIVNLKSGTALLPGYSFQIVSL